ncbi:hypothetical protein MMC25_005997 [Agyrium rufum]|nr:hypothetical protein [Agyrium rufum]
MYADTALLNATIGGGILSVIVLITRLHLFSAWISSCRKVISDFRARRYYNPFKRNVSIYVQSKQHIKELSESAELSQQAVFSDLFNFNDTLKHIPRNEPATLRPRLYGRVLHVMSPANFDALYPSLQARLESVFDEFLETPADGHGFKTVVLTSLARRAAIDLMAILFFGLRLPDEPEYRSALYDYPRDSARTMAGLQLTPKFMAPLVRRLASQNGRARKQMIERVEKIVTDRSANWNEEPGIRKLTILDLLIECTQDSPYWTSHTLAESVAGIWFAGSHQPYVQLYFIVIELCRRPEYVAMLRNELDGCVQLSATTIVNLPLLESFMKEAMRISPPDLQSIRRKALKPFTFSNGGPHVPEGSVACVSSWDTLHNPLKYQNPDSFTPDRFRQTEAQEGNKRHLSKSTEVSEDFPVWGFGTRACPGRFHAMFVIKTIVVHLLTKFDFQLADEHAATEFYWETFKIPYATTRIMLRPRDDVG